MRAWMLRTPVRWRSTMALMHKTAVITCSSPPAFRERKGSSKFRRSSHLGEGCAEGGGDNISKYSVIYVSCSSIICMESGEQVFAHAMSHMYSAANRE
mmetsp:Transcript_99/g.220  ORF Transcript_99/g.220 Transcript_99/m.220 type:complete len:98 (+) Transcript_99:685-978(+)